jgi:hypothetical protein
MRKPRTRNPRPDATVAALMAFTAAVEKLDEKLDLLQVEQEFTTDATAAAVRAIDRLASEMRAARETQAAEQA